MTMCFLIVILSLFVVEADDRDGFAALSAGIDRLLGDLKDFEKIWKDIKEETMMMNDDDDDEETSAQPAPTNESIIPDLTSFFSFSGSLSFATPSNTTTTAPVAEPATALTSAEQRTIILQKIRKLKQKSVQVKQDSQPNPVVTPTRVSHSAQTDKEVCYSHLKCIVFLFVQFLLYCKC